MKEIAINIIGAGWVTAKNFGCRGETGRPILLPGKPKLPPAESVFTPLPSRYRRFDPYTRLGCSAIALALKDAGLDRFEKPRPIGIVVSSVYECFEVDLAFYDTTHEDDGLFASPNLFSYTLPGIVTGEAAIHFQLTGPTFTVGDTAATRGLPAIKAGVDMIQSGLCESVVCGWLDSPGPWIESMLKDVEPIHGAVFVVLSAVEIAKPNLGIGPHLRLGTREGKRHQMILDLFEI